MNDKTAIKWTNWHWIVSDWSVTGKDYAAIDLNDSAHRNGRWYVTDRNNKNGATYICVKDIINGSPVTDISLITAIEPDDESESGSEDWSEDWLSLIHI